MRDKITSCEGSLINLWGKSEPTVEAYLIYYGINQYPNVIEKSAAQQSSLPAHWCIYTLMVLHFEGNSCDSLVYLRLQKLSVVGFVSH